MNNKRRDLLRSAIKHLDKALNCVGQALDEEQDCFDNMPENLESSECYEKMDIAISNLYDAIENIDSAKENVEDACA